MAGHVTVAIQWVRWSSTQVTSLTPGVQLLPLPAEGGQEGTLWAWLACAMRVGNKQGSHGARAAELLRGLTPEPPLPSKNS